jgi:hypothetical protein
MALRDILELRAVRDLSNVRERQPEIRGDVAEILPESISFANRAHALDRCRGWSATGGPVVNVEVDRSAHDVRRDRPECRVERALDRGGRPASRADQRCDLAFVPGVRRAYVRYLLICDASVLPDASTVRRDAGCDRGTTFCGVSATTKRGCLIGDMIGRVLAPPMTLTDLCSSFRRQHHSQRSLSSFGQVRQARTQRTHGCDDFALANEAYAGRAASRIKHAKARFMAAGSPPTVDVSATGLRLVSVLAKPSRQRSAGEPDVPNLSRFGITKSVHNPSHSRDFTSVIGRIWGWKS